MREFRVSADHLLKDAYPFEFLDLPDGHSETDLYRVLLGNLGRLLGELESPPKPKRKTKERRS